jgi:hypothetical protein
LENDYLLRKIETIEKTIINNLEKITKIDFLKNYNNRCKLDDTLKMKKKTLQMK